MTEPGVFPPFLELNVSGSPRERGRAFAAALGDRIGSFYEREFLGLFLRWGVTREEIDRMAESFLPAAEKHLPALLEELQGISDGTGLSLTQIYSCLAHEEIYHLPEQKKSGHCICFSVSTGESGTGDSYTGQTWDWMRCMFGHSVLTHWEDEDHNRILFYGYPSIPYGAGMNGHGLAFTWMSGGLGEGPRMGIGLPAYALIYGILQQPSIEEAVRWMREIPHAGWFNFILCDTRGEVACIEGAPGLLGVTRSHGYMARHCFYQSPELRAGTRQDPGGPLPPVWHRESRMLQILQANLGRMNRGMFEAMLTESHSGCEICYGPGDAENPDASMSVDLFYFQPSGRRAWFARGPLHGTPGPFVEVSL